MDEYDMGKEIARLRKAQSLTQVGLADLIHVTDKAVSKWESGGGSPEITTLVPLAKALGVTTDYLLTGKGECAVGNKYEEYVNMCVADGVIDIKKLLGLNNLSYLKKGLKEYPIHEIEKLCLLFKNEKWDELYRFAINVGNSALTQCFLDGAIDRIEKVLINEYWNKYFYVDYNNNAFSGMNGEYIFPEGNIDDIRFQSLKEISGYLDERKKGIIHDYEDKERFLADKNKEYFQNELLKGYPNNVIEELGERLDYILTYKYPRITYLAHKLSAYYDEVGLNHGDFKIDQYKNDDIVNLMIKFVKNYEQIKDGRIPETKMLVCEIEKCLNFILDIK